MGTEQFLWALGFGVCGMVLGVILFFVGLLSINHRTDEASLWFSFCNLILPGLALGISGASLTVVMLLALVLTFLGFEPKEALILLGVLSYAALAILTIDRFGPKGKSDSERSAS